MDSPNNTVNNVNSILRTIFFALLLDILAFTIILPLFPRILDQYKLTDGSNKDTLFFYFLEKIKYYKFLIGARSDLDIVLLGGAIGSLFSFLQFISSPHVGSLSDKYGRRTILLLSMFGNALSMLLWMFAKTFPIFLLSRIVGGLTEGNVQMSIAMISDVTTDHNRSKGLALVGIAFALGFTVGPPLGAFFSAIDLNQLFPHLKNLPFHQYSFPAVFAFVLILIETFYMYLTLPETVNFKKNLEKSNKNENENDINVGESKSLLETKEALEKSSDVKLTEHSGKNVNILSFIHFFYLFFFSGMEFTLTFLTYDRFQFTNMSQGTLLGFIGILSALVQGGYVRRVAHKSVHERSLAIQGVLSCGIGLGIIALVAKKYLGQQFLFVGASFLAFTSGTVVSSLTALASFESKSSQGKNLGKFRAFGQLGRSVGPIFSSSIYWVYGGVYCYSIGSVFMLFVTVLMIYLIPSPGDWKNKEKVKVA